MNGVRQRFLELVTASPQQLKNVPEVYKSDPEVVMAAVLRDSGALHYAAEELKGCREIVLAAVARNGEALQYASEQLRSD
eukprot:2317976-Amphidinium_carterae.1